MNYITNTPSRHSAFVCIITWRKTVAGSFFFFFKSFVQNGWVLFIPSSPEVCWTLLPVLKLLHRYNVWVSLVMEENKGTRESSWRWELTPKAVEAGCKVDAASSGAQGATEVRSGHVADDQNHPNNLHFIAPQYQLLVFIGNQCQPWRGHTKLMVQVLTPMQVSKGGVQGGHDTSTADRTWESCLGLGFLY